MDRGARIGNPSRWCSLSAPAAAKSEEFDFDERVVHQVDTSIWSALFNGHFKLAVPCDRCGRWLTAGTSKRNHRGPRCAAKEVTAPRTPGRRRD